MISQKTKVQQSQPKNLQKLSKHSGSNENRDPDNRESQIKA